MTTAVFSLRPGPEDPDVATPKICPRSGASMALAGTVPQWTDLMYKQCEAGGGRRHASCALNASIVELVVGFCCFVIG
ncbi:hypothetical protein NDU88_005738 [Pleurodeles waltl]|uniref:Uncharacterized protein n=1 Tax=Pleurodeles waltl TaxID=8319 RepID=A0AAV7UKC9_PLEWA|nr:hypothetical protein NDU88_005738 [Pleurodeles waltl]